MLLKELIPSEHNFDMLNEDLHAFSEMARQWNISFNISKSKINNISNKASLYSTGLDRSVGRAADHHVTGPGFNTGS